MTNIKLKVQQILPTLDIETSEACFISKLENMNLISSDAEGAFSLYVVVDLKCSSNFKTSIVSKIFDDVLTRTFEDNVSVSVPQALEKAVAECKNASLKVCEDAEFNCGVFCFARSNLYMVLYGNSKAYTLQGLDIVPLESAREGSFSIKSQELKGDEVLILSTESFDRTFPPKVLLKLEAALSSTELDKRSGAVIIKVESDSINMDAGKESIQNVASSTESTLSVEESSAKLRKLGLLLKSKLAMLTASPKKAFLFGGSLILILLLGYLAFKVFAGKSDVSTLPRDASEPSVVTQTPVDTAVNEDPKQLNGELQKQLDSANKVTRVAPIVFYDISIADENFLGDSLAVDSNYLAASDSRSGKIFLSSLNVTKFEELPQIFPGVKNLNFEDGLLTFTDNEGVKYYSLQTKAVSRSYATEEGADVLGPSVEFSGFTYSVKENDLIKHTKVGNSLTGATWASSPDFSKSVSVAIDGSIYVLLNDGTLNKYSAGQKDDFTVVGVNSALTGALKVVARADLSKIYIADSFESRIVVLRNDGVLDFQIKAQDDSLWKSMTSFAVSSDEKKFYVLAGSKVYEVSL